METTRQLVVFRQLCCVALGLLALSAAPANGDYYFVRAFQPQGTGSSVVSLAAEAGTLYAATDGDSPDRTVQVFNTLGNYTGKIGLAEAPNSVAVGAGTVYLADGFGGGIYGFGAFSGQVNPGEIAIGGVFRIAADSTGGVWSTNPPGKITQYVAGSGQVGQFDVPGFVETPGIGFNLQVSDIAVDPTGSTIFVALSERSIGGGGGDRILQLALDGTLIQEFGGTGSGNGQFKLDFSSGISLTPDLRLYVADSGNNRVQVFDALTGTYLAQFGTAGSGNGQFNHPGDVAVDDLGNVWVYDQGGRRIQQFTQVPEPSSVVLMTIAACSLLIARKPRRFRVAL